MVLIGDAAGHNDPIIGQGLAMSLSDVRDVAETLTSGGDWSVDALRPYGLARAERMRRMRNVGRAVRDAEFGEGPRERRRRAAERMRARPELMAAAQAPFVGPNVLPPEAYEPETMSAILG